MGTRSRRVAVVGILAALVVLTGCTGSQGGVTPTTDGTPAGAGYHAPASEYLLSADQFAGWTANGTRSPGGPSSSIPGVESGRVLELKNGSASLQIALLVFASPADARSFLRTQRETYRSDGIDTSNVSVGEQAFATTSLTETAVDARQANVYVQVTGNVPLNASTQYARAQLQAVTGS